MKFKLFVDLFEGEELGRRKFFIFELSLGFSFLVEEFFNYKIFWLSLDFFKVIVKIDEE